MKIFVAALVLFTCLNAHAGWHPIQKIEEYKTWFFASPEERKEIETRNAIKDISTQLIRELSPMVVTLSRDVHLYHWARFKFDDPESVGIRSPMWKTYVQGVTNGFWKYSSKAESFNEGRGLYAAIEPTSTTGYGNTVLEINLQKGTRVLNHGGDLQDHIHALLIEHHIVGRGLEDFHRAQPYIHMIKTWVVAKLNVAGYTYVYNNNASLYCKSHSQIVAFVLSGTFNPATHAANLKGIDVLGFVPKKSRESAQADEAEHARVGGFMTYMLHLMSFQEGDHLVGLAFNGDDKIASASEIQSLRKSTFSCDRLYLEDYPSAGEYAEREP